jgi:hypothetical protein
LAADLGVLDYDLRSKKILDQTRTFTYPAAPADAAANTIPSVSAGTSNHCDLVDNGLHKVSLISIRCTRGQSS